MEQDSGDTPSQQFSCIYFGFASNLSPRTMKQRCPSAVYAGLAVLRGWKFVVSELGFGNIVPGAEDDVVYGGLNFLSRRDEDALDVSEELGSWHEKLVVKVVRLLDPLPGLPVAAGGDGAGAGAGAGQEVEVEVMTYVDVKRRGEGVISKDYIVWLRRAVVDGLRAGVPPEYFEKYVNRFLPPDETVGKEDHIMMVRTLQLDKNDTAYVPTHLLGNLGQRPA